MAQSHGTVPPLRVERWTCNHDSTLLVLEAHTCFLNHLGNQAHFGKWMKMDIHSDPSTSIHIHFGFVDFGGCGCGIVDRSTSHPFPSLQFWIIIVDTTRVSI